MIKLKSLKLVLNIFTNLTSVPAIAAPSASEGSFCRWRAAAGVPLDGAAPRPLLLATGTFHCPWQAEVEFFRNRWWGKMLY